MIEVIFKAFVAAMWFGAFAIGFCFGCAIAILYCLGWGVVKMFEGIAHITWLRRK